VVMISINLKKNISYHKADVTNETFL